MQNVVLLLLLVAHCYAADLTAWRRISWWEGPDDEGHLWLMIDFRAAVSASRTHGPEMVARVLVSNVSIDTCCACWLVTWLCVLQKDLADTEKCAAQDAGTATSF